LRVDFRASKLRIFDALILLIFFLTVFQVVFLVRRDVVFLFFALFGLPLLFSTDFFAFLVARDHIRVVFIRSGGRLARDLLYVVKHGRVDT
jgi:hypothetical protein